MALDLSMLLDPEEDFSTPEKRNATAAALRRQYNMGTVGQLMGIQPTQMAGTSLQEASQGSLKQALLKQQAERQRKSDAARTAIEDQRYAQQQERQARLDQQNLAHQRVTEQQGWGRLSASQAAAQRAADAAAAATGARNIASGIKQREEKSLLLNALDAGKQNKALVDRMLAAPGRKAATGASGAIASKLPYTDARNFQGMHNQLMGGAFLEAFKTLKGGGQITEIEGKKATDAITILNTPGLTEGQYELGLKQLGEVIDTGIAKTSAAAYDAGYLQDSPMFEGSGDPRQQQPPQRDFMGEYGQFFQGGQ
jgi:hypothetical protein